MKDQITLTAEHIEKLEYLRTTTITGRASEEPKTLEQIAFQAIERGIASIEQTRKQYERTRAAVRAFAKK